MALNLRAWSPYRQGHWYVTGESGAAVARWSWPWRWGVSPRHLSFVETGRSKASPELLLALSEHLEVPLRERNVILLAGGYAPRFPPTTLGSAEMGRVHQTLERVLAGHGPYPGLVIDRYWDVVLANDAGRQLTVGMPQEVIGPPLNVFRASLHPDGLARRTFRRLAGPGQRR
jgi:MmyB-like transcription regulator ligand binding domain/Helix-turn-helix